MWIIYRSFTKKCGQFKYTLFGTFEVKIDPLNGQIASLNILQKQFFSHVQSKMGSKSNFQLSLMTNCGLIIHQFCLLNDQRDLIRISTDFNGIGSTMIMFLGICNGIAHIELKRNQKSSFYTRDDCEQPSLNQLKRCILYCCAV